MAAAAVRAYEEATGATLVATGARAVQAAVMARAAEMVLVKLVAVAVTETAAGNSAA